MTTLKSFASWLEVVLCDAATPVERRIAVLPISITWPLKVLFGMASMVMSAVWSSFTLTMSVSSTFTSAVMSDMSAIVMMVLAGRILDARDHGFAGAHRQIGDHAVERRHDIVTGAHIGEARQRLGLGHAFLRAG